MKIINKIKYIICRNKIPNEYSGLNSPQKIHTPSGHFYKQILTFKVHLKNDVCSLYYRPHTSFIE